MSGKVVHFEIPVDDVARAQAFYREAFGWSLTDVPEMDYTMVGTVKVDTQGMPSEPGAINGGMFRRQSPLTAPIVVVDVDDLDVALERVVQLGGTVVKGRQAVGDMGFVAYVSDPENNVIGVWQTA